MSRDTYEREYAAATEAERLRIQAILTSPEAKERYELAKVLALDTDVHADAAVGILAAAPKTMRFGPMARLNSQQVIEQEIDAEVKRILEA